MPKRSIVRAILDRVPCRAHSRFTLVLLGARSAFDSRERPKGRSRGRPGGRSAGRSREEETDEEARGSERRERCEELHGRY